jgi:hypothetical protein
MRGYEQLSKYSVLELQAQYVSSLLLLWGLNPCAGGMRSTPRGTGPGMGVKHERRGQWYTTAMPLKPAPDQLSLDQAHEATVGDKSGKE